jgi:hypothetical protein
MNEETEMVPGGLVKDIGSSKNQAIIKLLHILIMAKPA